MSKRKKWLRGMTATVVVVIIVGIGLFLYATQRQSDPIPSSIINAVTYPLYYPAELPGGYLFDKGSFEASNQAVLYSLIKPNSPNIAVSIQAKPIGFDFDDFHTQKLTGSKEVVTRSGKAIVGIYNGRTIASLVTDKSWVLITAPDKIPLQEIEAMVKSLTITK